MAVESKPLSHTEVIHQHVRWFKLPARVEDSRSKLQHWADLIASSRAVDFKETALDPDFITDIFCRLLGYTRAAGLADTFTLPSETFVEARSQRSWLKGEL